MSHAGVALLRALADKSGLTAGLSKALASRRLLVHDRGRVLADLACAIADGAEVISDFRVTSTSMTCAHPRLRQGLRAVQGLSCSCGMPQADPRSSSHRGAGPWPVALSLDDPGCPPRCGLAVAPAQTAAALAPRPPSPRSAPSRTAPQIRAVHRQSAFQLRHPQLQPPPPAPAPHPVPGGASHSRRPRLHHGPQPRQQLPLLRDHISQASLFRHEHQACSTCTKRFKRPRQRTRQNPLPIRGSASLGGRDDRKRSHTGRARRWARLVAVDATGVLGFAYFSQFLGSAPRIVSLPRREQHLRPRRCTRSGGRQGLVAGFSRMLRHAGSAK